MNTQTFATRRIAAAIDPAIYKVIEAAHRELLRARLDALDYHGVSYMYCVWHGTWPGVEAQMCQYLGFALRAEASLEWALVVNNHRANAWNFTHPHK